MRWVLLRFVPGFVLIGINYIIGVLIIRKMIDLKV